MLPASLVYPVHTTWYTYYFGNIDLSLPQVAVPGMSSPFLLWVTMAPAFNRIHIIDITLRRLEFGFDTRAFN